MAYRERDRQFRRETFDKHDRRTKVASKPTSDASRYRRAALAQIRSLDADLDLTIDAMLRGDI